MQNLFGIEKALSSLSELQAFIEEEMGGMSNFKAALCRLLEFDREIVRAGGVKEFLKRLEYKK